MFREIFRKEVSRVESIDDLQNDRARAIAYQYKLDIREILPRYLELTKEVMANGGQIEIDIDNSNTPLNVHEAYKRKLACGAVLSYELTQRDALQFPVVEQPRIINVGEEAFLATARIKGNFHRTAPVEVYEQIGKYYEQVIGLLNRHQGANLDRMLGGKTPAR
jgi:hypothetical protein